MANDPTTLAFILEQMAGAGDVSARPMFGEHGLYCDGKMVAMMCDGRLFVKPTAGGRAFAGDLEELPPYPGAKPCLLVDAARGDDRDWVARLVAITAAELSPPRPRAARGAKSR